MDMQVLILVVQIIVVVCGVFLVGRVLLTILALALYYVHRWAWRRHTKRN